MNHKQLTIHVKAVSLAIVLLLLPGIQSVQAQANEVAALRAQVQELQRMVIDLQQQVQELQARMPSRPSTTSSTRPEAPVTNNTPRIRGYVRPDLTGAGQDRTAVKSPTLTPATIRENWHNLKKGMSNQTVSSMLGAPSRSFKLNNSLVWYYDYEGIGKGSVMFSEQGEVTAWQAPPSSHWFW